MLLVTHRSNLDGVQRGLIDAMRRACRLTLWLVEERGWPGRVTDLGESAGAAAVIWFVKFRHLLERGPFDWQSYSGARVMLDMDACQNFSAVASRRYLGRWPAVVQRNRFDALVCTGGVVAQRFREIGVPAVWIPKGYDATRIRDEGRADRAGVCSFGTAYPARRVALAMLRRNGLAPETFRCAPAELGDRLNRYAGCVVCNMEVRGARYLPTRMLARVPPALLGLTPGPEPMTKNFEVAGAGCAPICDAVDDLDALGFVDGETMVSYSSGGELVERVRHYAEHPDELVAIGRRAATLARARHTWDHRARELVARFT